MARLGLPPSQGTAPPYPLVSRKTQAEESLPPPHASSADPHPPTTMTGPFYNPAAAPSDDQLYAWYPDLHDFSSTGHGSAAASGGHSRETTAEISAIYETEGDNSLGWDYDGLDNLELAFPPSTPGIARIEGSHGIQPQAPWDCGVQEYPAMMGDPIVMADPMANYASMGGCYEPPNWSQPQMGQISPSPSLGSHYDSSPVSICGPQFSREHSWSFLPASRAAAAEHTRFDARFMPVTDQAVSPVENRLTPGGTEPNGGLHTVIESPSSADRRTGPPHGPTRDQTLKAEPTATPEQITSTVSPSFTPSPAATAAAASYQPVSQTVRHAPDRQRVKSNGKKAPQSTRVASQKGAGAERSQVQQSQSQSQARAQAQAQAQAAPLPPPQQKQKAQPVPRTRNREAANKCRAKTKVAAAELESTEREMSTAHQHLSATARSLRDEVLLLKTQLLAHGNCDDAVIQQYLINQARMVGGGGGGGGSMAAHYQHQHQHHHHYYHNDPN